jgi:urease accessory protein UreE
VEVAVEVALEVALELALGEPLNTVTGVPLEVQAESATQAIMVVRPQPTAVYRTRCDVHAMAVRTLIEPPHALGNDHFPVAARRNRRRKSKRVAGLWSLTAPAGERTGHKDRRP